MNILKTLFSSNSSPPPSQPSQKTSAILDTLGRQALTLLQQCVNIAGRKGILRRTAESLLSSGKDWAEVRWRQFAMMHAPSMIRETSFEGGAIDVSIARWTYLFELYKRNEANFLPCNLTSGQLNKVLEELHELKGFNNLIPVNITDIPLTAGAVEASANEIRKTCRPNSSRKEAFIFLSGMVQAVFPMGTRFLANSRKKRTAFWCMC